MDEKLKELGAYLASSHAPTVQGWEVTLGES